MGVISHKHNVCYIVWKMTFWHLVVGAVGLIVMVVLGGSEVWRR